MAKMNPIQVQQILEDVDYPVSKDELVKKVKAGGADETVINTIREAPVDEFISPIEVSEMLDEME